ncbi:family 16 glycosylhydrolase [Thalassomonas sp. M1454]|nr:family 16 glycosylhydrolase [Thalassomonas sp. M1454]
MCWLVCTLAACSNENELKNKPEKALEYSSDKVNIKTDNRVVWAINIGGNKHLSIDNINYQADTLPLSTNTGVIDNVLGSQDPFVFQTYRQGDFDINKKLPNGLYDIIFKFAEPNDVASGERVFDVYAQQNKVIADLDIRRARDGKSKSALVRAVTDIAVTNSQLELSFKGKVGMPVLNAIVVRKKHTLDSDWRLVWQDEFNIDGKPDANKWNYDIWPARKVNDEDQTYTDRLKNARVEQGKLIIEAHKEQYNNAQYTSARLQSSGKGDFLYGRAEIRAKIPAGQGTWPAIWMLPTDFFKYATNCDASTDGHQGCDAWPNSGEIDIMEHVGYDMQTIHGTVHNKAYYWVNWQQRKSSVEGVNVDKVFHRYAIEWSPEHIEIFFDDTPYFYYKNEHAGWQAWPYDHPYHIILNLAIGGMWGRAGGPIDDSIFPVRMEVDYVRIYQK